MHVRIAATVLVVVALAAGQPRFADYPARVETTAPKLDLTSHPKARRYRTVLRTAVANGVNFAGHYVFAQWGCGSSCTEFALVDGQSGEVRFPEELSGAFFPWFADREDVMNHYEVSFHSNSRLLVITGVPFGEDLIGTYQYVLEDGRFTLLKGEPLPEAPRPRSSEPDN